MAPRRRNQEGDVPPRFVEEQVANIEGGQGVGAEDIGGSENLLSTAGPTEHLSIHHFMEENRRMFASLNNEFAGSKGEFANFKGEVNQRFDALTARHDSLESRVDRRLGQLFEVVTKNRHDFDVFVDKNLRYMNEIRELLGRPVMQPRDLPLNGENNLNSETGFPNNGARNSPPRQGVPPIPMVNSPTPRVNIGETSTAANTRVEPPSFHGGGPQNTPEARPYVAPMSGGVGGGTINNDHVPPRGYPQNVPSPPNGLGMDPRGFIPQGGQLGRQDVNAIRDQVAQMLTDQFGLGIRPAMPPVYRKPYPDWVDRYYPFPRGFRVPDFITFSGTGDQSTVEHVGRFTVQCGDVSDFLKLRLFGNSLTGPAFAWYVNLPSNSVQTWQQMEQMFHAQFYRPEQEVTMANLARMRQQLGETVEHFLTNFKNARNRCFVNLTERELVKLAQGDLNFELRKKFQDREFSDLFQLMSYAIRYESLLHEEEHKRSGSHGKYFPNFENYGVNNVGSDVDEVEVDLAKNVQGKPYVCASLAKADGEPQAGKPNRAPIQPRKYSFDVSKSDTIFDQLYRDGQIKLTVGQTIPPAEKLKGKRYCKWHNNVSHSTNMCVVFRNVVQDAIEKGQFKVPEPRKEAMTIDTDPFPNGVGVNMVNIVGGNIVEALLYHKDLGSQKIRRMEGGPCNVAVSSTKVLGKACLNSLSEIVRPSMLALGGPPKSE
ncbi:unnamed protein product [Linum trigynum]|uniref:Retrotransposon gag domain-containing protein n=1 Tax=Linum trigynum TaxID=586398 RepID=A0AAV2EVD4_9ROSI